MEWVKSEKCILEMEKGGLKKELQRADNFRRAEGRQICWLKLNEKMKPTRAPRRKGREGTGKEPGRGRRLINFGKDRENAAEMQKAENEGLKNEYKADLERQNEMKRNAENEWEYLLQLCGRQKYAKIEQWGGQSDSRTEQATGWQKVSTFWSPTLNRQFTLSWHSERSRNPLNYRQEIMSILELARGIRFCITETYSFQGLSPAFFRGLGNFVEFVRLRQYLSYITPYRIFWHHIWPFRIQLGEPFALSRYSSLILDCLQFPKVICWKFMSRSWKSGRKGTRRQLDTLELSRARRWDWMNYHPRGPARHNCIAPNT